ncbi:helicase-exonuclease AddAB subunit AddA [Clostridium sp. cel8]|uniref:helicase-exonuclease AddAB subunit AddA n=1 Tax=Clostridium sp. cel8 TaxID=2663123 RepID=UPI0015F7209A|nr:helicase-exonuclease AddAB subunit AddA [Clostridium sp. cel8]MBA5849949.1 helicase-exonuclease AddAB subunit AddA [Clostridium sp. cel8]
MTKWTDEQREAIYTETGNILVAAGAGAGKTAVLVNRIVRKIIDKNSQVDIDKLLVVTYTNAAASEMKERIGNEIQKSLEENFQSKNLQKQLTLLNQSNIMTMHSFCLKVIKENFQVIDLDPNFRVANSEESILLKQESISEVFEERYNNEDENFLLLVDSFGDKDDSKVKDIVMDLYEFVQSLPWPKKWLYDASENFNLKNDFDFATSKWADIIILDLKKEIKRLIHKLKVSIELMNSCGGFEAYIDVFLSDISKFEDLLKLNLWNEINSSLEEFKFLKLPSLKNENCNENVKKKVVKTRNGVKKAVKDIQENILSHTKNIDKSIKHMYPIIKCLTNVVNDFEDRYSQKKREKDIVDFNDIEHFCLKILTKKNKKGEIIPSDIALYYRDFFEEILIDEYQDINSVQEVIINMISKKSDFSDVFMVGDVKQSIYRFRQAKPELFLKKYKSYSDEKKSKNRRIKLFKNFRSRSNIIDSVNYLFSQVMCSQVGELDYNEEEELKSEAMYPEFDKSTFKNDCIELNLIDKLSEEKDESEENLDNIQIEARLVANKINELINSSKYVYDKDLDSYRNITYKDIVVLMRSTKNWAPYFVEQFNNFGIPVFADTSTGYFETIEIKTIMSLLQIIDNPIQDIPLLAVLRSPIEYFSPEELIDIRIVNRNVPFYEALCACISNESELYSTDHIDNELKNKISKFISRLNTWRKKVVHMPMDEFLWYLYMDTGYYGFVGAMPGGTQRQANLRMLFQKAEEYEKSSYKGLFNFINFINKLKVTSGDMGSAKILGENEDVVRIMSIHKSKGLEFPVVILAGAGKNFNLTDMNKQILYNEELGIGPDYIDCNRRIKYPTIIKRIFRNRTKMETLSEEMRILYVAFTRAKEKLIITGMVKDLSKTCKKWCEEGIAEGRKVPEYALLEAKSYLDWIGFALARHKDGEIIRKASPESHINQSQFFNLSKWNIVFWNRDDLSKLSDERDKYDFITEIKARSLNEDRSKYFDEINRRFNWKYKYYDAVKIPAKFSVSELKRKFSPIDDEDAAKSIDIINVKKPNFIKENKTISAADRGTIMHLAMQHIDIQNTDSKDSIKDQIKNLVTKEFITEKESRVISINKIFKFFNSELGKRMKKSNQVHREVPFYIEVYSGDIYDNLPDHVASEKILLQGIIDCYFEEDDGIVILDYKTDYVEDIEEIKEKYKIQIKYYSKALEKITGMRVKEKYLYLFNKNVSVKVE